MEHLIPVQKQGVRGIFQIFSRMTRGSVSDKRENNYVYGAPDSGHRRDLTAWPPRPPSGVVVLTHRTRAARWGGRAGHAPIKVPQNRKKMARGRR